MAKYPGPLLAKLTNLYAAYHAWKGDIHLDIALCHKRYGKLTASDTADREAEIG